MDVQEAKHKNPISRSKMFDTNYLSK